MGFFDDIFGGLFDFDGNGTTSPDEEFLGYMMMEDCLKEDGDDGDVEDSLWYE